MKINKVFHCVRPICSSTSDIKKILYFKKGLSFYRKNKYFVFSQIVEISQQNVHRVIVMQGGTRSYNLLEVRNPQCNRLRNDWISNDVVPIPLPPRCPNLGPNENVKIFKIRTWKRILTDITDPQMLQITVNLNSYGVRLTNNITGAQQ